MDASLVLAAAFVALVLASLALFWRENLASRRPLPSAAPPEEKEGRGEAAEVSPLLIAVAAAMDDGLLLIAADRRISFANASAGGLLGTPGSVLRGQSVMAGLRDFQADQTIERALASGEAQSITFRISRTGRTVRLSCQPLSDSGARAVVLLRDLTQIAHLERARREMVANVSHELRTPLASVRLLVETLAGEPPPEVARRMLGQIDDELTAMTQLIDELGELAQIESGRLALKLRAVAIPDLAARATERLRPMAERRRLVLRHEFPMDLPPVLVDEDRIGQVLVNLLHNALKWTPEGGTITVSGCVAVPPPDERTARELQRVDGSGWIKLSIQDTGIGIPTNEIERVFERFYKVDRARTRDSGGTGLGLAIAKHLVERHGGRIWAESREGHGSTFSMLLPTA